MIKKIAILAIVAFCIIFYSPQAFAHKPISPSQNNFSYETSLQIPDHKISWVIFEELGKFEAKFYSFEAKKGDSFYSSIVIPKLEGLENYKPSLALAGEGIQIQTIKKIKAELPPGGIVVYDYTGSIPSKEFYEPFGQVTFWERQEVRISIPEDGTYYVIVFDNQGTSGKYALAIGTIEDFSTLDFFTVLPAAWFEAKIFAEDYLSPSIVIIILAIIPTIIIFRRSKKNKFVQSKVT